VALLAAFIFYNNEIFAYLGVEEGKESSS